MEIIDTPCGPLPVTGVVERFESGQVQTCTPAAEAALSTSLGSLVPQHTTDDLRRRTVQAVSFHESGALRALPLERPTLIETPAGPMTVELVTFHPDGSLARAFPLNGKLSGMWTQEDEGALAKPVSLRTPVGVVTARLIGAAFDPEGRLLSLTLWPGDTVPVPTPVGELAARVGISFRPDGTLRSIEPAKPQPVPTPAGMVQAYDLDAVGINGDVNSLCFNPDGGVEAVSTSLTQVLATGPDGQSLRFAPESRESLCGDGDREPVPMRLEFCGGLARLRTRDEAPWTELPLGEWGLRTEPFLRQFANPFGKMSCSC